MKTDILVIGGGLSGLRVAQLLEQQGRDWQLAEARDRFGGRILTKTVDAGYFDLGPSWFWPGQPRIAALIDALDLSRFDQHADGLLTYEDEQGRVQRGKGFSSMQGSRRLQGGLGRLVHRIVDQLPKARLQLNASVRAIERNTDRLSVGLADGRTVSAKSIVLALPPRIVAHAISFSPTLLPEAQHAMRAVPTWMAGHAKVVVVYPKPFWRDAGLSGDAMSRHGPMAEIHDASPAEGGPFALFGFLGVPPSMRTDQAQLKQSILAQLVRLFGQAAANPQQLFLKDWAFDPTTATPQDHAPLYAHPHYAMPPVLDGLWDGRILFAGTEVAPQFGGYLEGALEAAEAVVNKLHCYEERQDG